MWRINIFDLLPFVAAITALITIASHTKRVVARGAPPRNRTDRIWHVATLFGLLTAMTVSFSMFRRLSMVDATFNTSLWLFGVGALSLLWVWSFDWFLSEMGAQRNSVWRLAAPISFALGFSVVVLLPISVWIGRFPALDVLVLPINAGAAGYWWWSCLRPPGPGLNEVFE